MTQAVLAGRVGVTQSYISKVEQGVQTIDRRSLLVGIAEALQVTVADLLGQPGDATDPNKAKATLSVPDLRLALVEVQFASAGTPSRSRDELVKAMAANDRKRLVCDFAAAAPELPQILRDAAAYGPVLLSEALHSTASVLRSLGYRDLAWRASDLALDRAREAENDALLAAAQFMRLMTLPPEAHKVIELEARRTYEDLQQRAADPLARRGYGALHLSAALAEAQAGRKDLVLDHLTEAHREALTLGEPAVPGGLSMSFGPTNVGLWRMATFLESGEYEKVVDIAKGIRPQALPHANRQSSYFLDLGRALSHIRGQDRQAIISLARAEAAAPQYVRGLPAARNVVNALIARAQKRAIADDLRRLATKLGLQPV